MILWRRMAMIFVIGEVFKERLASDSKSDILKTMPLALAVLLNDKGHRIHLGTRFKASEDLQDIKTFLEESDIFFNQFADEDTYTLDDWDLEHIYDSYANDTLVFFSNVGDDTIESMASYGNDCDCKSVLYINKLFISKKALQLMSHYFIEEQFVKGYAHEIAADKVTVIPNRLNDVEIAQLMINKIAEIERTLNKI